MTLDLLYMTFPYTSQNSKTQKIISFFTYIHSKRPNLSNSSLITYTSILKNIYHKVFGNDVDFHKFDDAQSILHYLKDMPPNRRKTILSALLIITDNKQYRDLMMQDVQEYNKDISKQEKTSAQQASWVNHR